jgi:hypothetical protein
MRKRRWVRDTGKAWPDRVAYPATTRISQGSRGRTVVAGRIWKRVLHANEETALNPDPFDPAEPEFVAGAVVELGIMRQGRYGSCRCDERTGPACGGAEEGIFVSARTPTASIQAFRQASRSRRGSAPRARKGSLALGGRGFPHLSPPNKFRICKTALAGRPDGWVIPLPGRRPSPCYPPVSPTGEGCSAALR